MSQKIRMPGYWPLFQCIASKCEETCCAGWYIAIDEAAYKKYKRVKQPEMRRRLDKEIVERKNSVSKECMAKIKLKNNRCAFLGQDQLCDIYRNLGESYLSQTCRIYPRNINAVGEYLELSLTLSCPEAARIILLQQAPLTFYEEESNVNLPITGGTVKLSKGKPKSLEEGLLVIRKQLIAILQNRDEKLKDRWQKMSTYFEELEGIKRRKDIKGLENLLKEGLKLKKSVKDKSEQTSKQAQVYWQAIIQMREQKKWSSPTYEHYYQQMVKGLSTGQPLEKESWCVSAYEEGKKRLERKLEGEWATIFENYFTAYIYERLVPLDSETPAKSFKELNFYFTLLKLHLCGMLIENEEVNKEDVVSLIQGFTRVFDHNEQCKEQLKKRLSKESNKK